jgi:hypothetical protein
MLNEPRLVWTIGLKPRIPDITSKEATPSLSLAASEAIKHSSLIEMTLPAPMFFRMFRTHHLE